MRERTIRRYEAVYKPKNSRNAGEGRSAPHAPVTVVIATAEMMRDVLIEKTAEEGIAQSGKSDE